MKIKKGEILAGIIHKTKKNQFNVKIGSSATIFEIVSLILPSAANPI